MVLTVGKKTWFFPPSLPSSFPSFPPLLDLNLVYYMPRAVIIHLSATLSLRMIHHGRSQSQKEGNVIMEAEGKKVMRGRGLRNEDSS